MATEPHDQGPVTGNAETHPFALWFGRILVAAWIPGLVLVIGALMVGHWVTLPTPREDDAQLSRAVAALRERHGIRDWTACHVLYAGCPCSRRVLEHVVATDRPAWLREVVLFVGEDAEFVTACRERGMTVVTVSDAELADTFGIEAAPLYLVVSADGAVRYVGGYTDHKQGLAFRDLEIAERLRRGQEVEPLPVYGCGVSTSLQDALDPLGLKY